MHLLVFLTIVLYFIPLIIAWDFFKVAYTHPKGVWVGLDPDMDDVLYVLLPLTNIAVCINRFFFTPAIDLDAEEYIPKFENITWAHRFFLIRKTV